MTALAQVLFDRCPPVAWGACMRDRGYPTSLCPLSATCCVRAPVRQVEELVQEGAVTAAMSRWNRERQAA